MRGWGVFSEQTEAEPPVGWDWMALLLVEFVRGRKGGERGRKGKKGAIGKMYGGRSLAFPRASVRAYVYACVHWSLPKGVRGRGA